MSEQVDAYGDLLKAEMKTEDGVQYPAAAFAYVPDADKPSTWKLRLWDSLEEKETKRQIGMAVAALGAGGFRGNRVKIPSDDLPKVKRRVLQAWLKVNSDKERSDAPRVLLSSRPVVRTPADEKEAEAEEQVEAGYDMDYENKGHGYGETAQGFDAMTHLLMAYRLMMDHEECWSLLQPVMDVIHELQDKMTTDAPEVEVEVYENSDKEIRQEDGQFCVYSTTGRSFGCYANAEEAQESLAQIERFKSDKIEASTTEQLVSYHDRLHAMKEVGTEHIVVHNLIEDELEGRGVAPPYDLGNVEKKLDMLNQTMTGITPVIKQDEQRYTLGPVYVPDMEDAHGEFTDAVTLQKALWDWVRKGDRRIFIQHSDKVAGEMVETLTWPIPIEVDLEVPNQGVTKQTFPPDTPFLGVVWEEWAWDLVKAGELRGYSIGGRAKRIEADLPEPAMV